MPLLSEAERQGIECAIELQEIEHAIDSLPSRKSPGPDGIGAEFYKRFKTEISPIFLKLFLRAYEIGSLPLSFKKAYTVLIPKTEDVANYRKLHATGTSR